MNPGALLDDQVDAHPGPRTFDSQTQRRHVWRTTRTTTKGAFREPTSKRRRGFPSETHVKRGRRVVHGDKELVEKLGRNDLCPCGSRRRFQEVLYAIRQIRRRP